LSGRNGLKPDGIRIVGTISNFPPRRRSSTLMAEVEFRSFRREQNLRRAEAVFRENPKIKQILY